jgi:hypothetical protein
LVDQQFRVVTGERQLVRQLATSKYYYSDDNVLGPLRFSQLGDKRGTECGRRQSHHRGGKSSWTTGPEITSASLNDGSGYLAPPDDDTVERAESPWHFKGSGHFDFTSTDAAAYAFGYIKWFNGNSLAKVFLRRAIVPEDYSSRVYAIKPVGCIWVQLKFGYLTTSASIPSGSLGISGAETVGEVAVKCRTGSQDRPDPIYLNKLGFAKSWLNSVTIMICSSPTKSAGASACAWNKNTYPN